MDEKPVLNYAVPSEAPPPQVRRAAAIGVMILAAVICAANVVLDVALFFDRHLGNHPRLRGFIPGGFLVLWIAGALSAIAGIIAFTGAGSGKISVFLLKLFVLTLLLNVLSAILFGGSFFVAP